MYFKTSYSNVPDFLGIVISLANYVVTNVIEKLGQPYIVQEGDEVMMSCWSYGKVEWYFEEDPVRHNSQIRFGMDVLIIDKVRYSDMGMYECFGTLRNERVFIKKLSLFVKVPTSSLGYLHPIVNTVSEGQFATFHCSVVSSIEWLHKEQAINGSNKYNISGNTLRIKNVKKADQGLVECFGYDNNTTYSYYSSHLLVRVNKVKKVTPSSVGVYYGRQANFICISDGKVFWLRDGKKINNYYSWNKELQLKNVTKKDTGGYSCYGSDNNGQDKFVAIGLLKIVDQTKVHPRMIIAEERGNAFFECHADRPLQTRNGVWKIPGHQYGFNLVELKTNHYVLAIKKVQYYNEGDYQCEGMADNAMFIARVSLVIRIRDDNQIRPLHIVASYGQMVSFMCVSFLEVKWFFNDDHLPYNAKAVQKMNGLENYVIIIDVSAQNVGVYKCHGKDPFSNTFYFAEGTLELSDSTASQCPTPASEDFYSSEEDSDYYSNSVECPEN